MQVFEARKGKPGHRRHLTPTGHAWNKHDEAYTENCAGRRGGRDSPKVDIAPKWLSQSARVVTHTEANTRPSVNEGGKQRRPFKARMRRAGGVHFKLWHVRRDALWNLGSPGYCLSENERTGVEYPHRESAHSGVADTAVVLGGGERPLQGKGLYGRT